MPRKFLYFRHNIALHVGPQALVACLRGPVLEYRPCHCQVHRVSLLLDLSYQPQCSERVPNQVVLLHGLHFKADLLAIYFSEPRFHLPFAEVVLRVLHDLVAQVSAQFNVQRRDLLYELRYRILRSVHVQVLQFSLSLQNLSSFLNDRVIGQLLCGLSSVLVDLVRACVQLEGLGPPLREDLLLRGYHISCFAVFHCQVQLVYVFAQFLNLCKHPRE